jgi:hypothetical protein
VLLAAENAEIIDPTAKIEITSILAEILFSNCLLTSVFLELIHEV